MPQLLLQPVIENAIRYGAEKTAGRADIVVKVRQNGFVLEIFVSNPIARASRTRRQSDRSGEHTGQLALIYDLEARSRRELDADGLN